MKLTDLTVKTVLALFIVIFGLGFLVFIEMSDTLQNSIINIIIMVVSYHFGSSAGSAVKDKVIASMNNSSKEDVPPEPEIIGGSQVPPKKDEK